MMTLIKNNKGFTLIEILVALSIDFVVLAGIYAAFYSQQKSHVKEQQVVDAQQNVRGAADFMTREIRLAGMQRLTAGAAGILTAGPIRSSSRWIGMKTIACSVLMKTLYTNLKQERMPPPSMVLQIPDQARS